MRGDPELVRLVQGGSRAAVEALYERYLPPVWRYVYTQVHGDEHAAEDVVSETFLAAISGLLKLDPEGGSLYAWLIGVARHKVSDHRRRLRRLRDDPIALSRGRGDARETADPQGSLEAAEEKTQVAGTMARLSNEERLVLEWKYVEELSVREMARRIGRTEKAVENLLYRARKSFRAAFEGLPG